MQEAPIETMPMNPVRLDVESLRRLIPAFQAEMRRGLAGEPSSIAMHPSFVGRPTGAERGRFVVLDLGGTNVRATVIELPGDGAIRTLRSETLRLRSTSGDADDLFRPVARFVGRLIEPGDECALGFIFAFPMEQTGIRSGRLTKWTKEFAFSGVEGEDVVRLLERAMRRESGELPSLRGVRVGALANDTVSALAAGALLDSRCDVGLIVATGMNLALAAPPEMIPADAPSGGCGEMLFNMECGNFDGVRGVMTPADRRLDRESGTDGQLLEKMISGRYLGEIVRLAASDASASGDGFRGWMNGDSGLAPRYSFTAELLSDAIHDTSADLAAVAMSLKALGVRDATLEDRRRLRDACVAVARRSARLVAVAIVAAAAYVDPDLERDHLVAADGSVFRGIPGYQVEVERGIADLLGDSADRVRVAYLREGSGLGAAVVAAAAGQA